MLSVSRRHKEDKLSVCHKVATEAEAEPSTVVEAGLKLDLCLRYVRSHFQFVVFVLPIIQGQVRYICTHLSQSQHH